MDDTATELIVRPLYRGIRILWYVLDTVEVLLLLRFTFLLFGANPTAGFTQLVYEATYPLVQPFFNVFQGVPVGIGTFEWNTLIAMIVCWLTVLALVRFLLILFARPIPASSMGSDFSRQSY